MTVKKLGRGLALVLAVCLLAALATACGGSSGGETTASEAGEAATEAETPATETETEGESEPAAESESSGEGAEILASFSTPPGSTLQGTKEGPKMVHQDYKTGSASPQEVVSFYEEQMSSAGWTIEQGDAGSAEFGVSAKLEGNYFDVESDVEGSKTHFELCAGPGTEPECEALSNESSDSSNSGNSSSSSDDDG